MGLEEKHATARLFGAAGFDLAPLERALGGKGFRPFDGQDLAFLDRLFEELAGFVGEAPVTEALANAEFAEDADVLLFSVIEGLPSIVLQAIGHESVAVPAALRRTLIAGVAENPDGAADVVHAAIRHGVSDRTVATIFHRGHTRVTGWRLYFLARGLLNSEEVLVSDFADQVATTEPEVFDGADLVIRTAADALRAGTLMIERAGRMPNAIVRGAWIGQVDMGELLAAAMTRVLEHRSFVGSDQPDEIGRLWRCHR